MKFCLEKNKTRALLKENANSLLNCQEMAKTLRMGVREFHSLYGVEQAALLNTRTCVTPPCSQTALCLETQNCPEQSMAAKTVCRKVWLGFTWVDTDNGPSMQFICIWENQFVKFLKKLVSSLNLSILHMGSTAINVTITRGLLFLHTRLVFFFFLLDCVNLACKLSAC